MAKLGFHPRTLAGESVLSSDLSDYYRESRVDALVSLKEQFARGKYPDSLPYKLTAK